MALGSVKGYIHLMQFLNDVTGHPQQKAIEQRLEIIKFFDEFGEVAARRAFGKSLSILGVKPDRPGAIASFFLNDMKEGTIGGMTGIFLTVEVLNELGRLTDDLRNYARQQIMLCQNKAGGFGALENIYIEVSSELEETYRAVKVLKAIGAAFDLL